MKNSITEDELEQLALDWFRELGYQVVFGPDIAPDGDSPERSSYKEVVLKNRLKRKIEEFNPDIPEEAREEALKKLLRFESQKLFKNNQEFHNHLINGIEVEYRKNGRIKGDTVNILGKNNEFLAINQYTIEQDSIRRPDIILFINGIPITIIELKNPVDEKATIWKAYNQLQTYKSQISNLYKYNQILIISDGYQAKAGTITSNKERFMAWKTINDEKANNALQLETLIKGMLNKETLIDLIKHFIVYQDNNKILGAYHQYNAANKALESTKKSKKKAGVVWHTQGSGKSLTMVFYAGKAVLNLDNPTIVVLTDRNDLDDQLFTTFAKSTELLRQKPDQAKDRNNLKQLLKVSSGGIVFTTIQKFFPEGSREEYETLSERENIIVIADEAHRSQYGFKGKLKQGEIKYGFAKYLRDALPNASFIGFTGTPIDKDDKSTRRVFGDYVDIYDIRQSVEDGMTVKILYESRLAKVDIKPEERPKLDEEFEEITEQEEEQAKEKLKTKWAAIEKIVGSEERIKKVANDLVNHFEKRTEVLQGKGMIVGMSRRICVDLYKAIKEIRPTWHNEEDQKGKVKIVMTGSASDPKSWQPHIRNKKGRKEIENRFKDEDDNLNLVIVRDMWLTGFDVPSLHTMYLDKPMKGHNLMQAIARVNRVWKDKEGGLIVDYIGVAPQLKKALTNYTEEDRSEVGIPQEQAVAQLKERYEIVRDLFHGFEYKKFFSLKPKERMEFITDAMDHILGLEDGKERFIKQVTALLKAFSLATPHEETDKLKEEVSFFQAVKSAIIKNTETKKDYTGDVDTAINQLLSKAIVSDRVIDVFEAAGIKKPDVSILSDDFLMEVKDMKQKNVAFETLKKLLNDKIRFLEKKNVVKARSFKELLEKTIRKYTNRSIETAEVIDELINMAQDVRESEKEPEELGLSEEEVAFYDALAENESAKKVLGDEILKKIATEIAVKIRDNLSIDWTKRDSERAKIKRLVKRTLRKYNYPPDKQKQATETVLEQAKAVCNDWAINGSPLKYATEGSAAMAVADKKEKYDKEDQD